MNAITPEAQAYIGSFTPDMQTRLLSLVDIHQRHCKGWPIDLKYGMLRFVLPRTQTTREAFFAGVFKNHIGFYPVYLIPSLEEDIKPFRTPGTKDSLRFLHTQPMPERLIDAIFKAKCGLS
ncbi:MAG TPA: hypothetical protein VFV37_00855 [Luteibaculaceae bacterium]|nr:hypothetical protein [Luteibaculaceae bacterium]